MMKRLSFFFCAALLCASCSQPVENVMECSPSIAIAPDDTPETIIMKAAHVVPKPIQYAALQNEFIAFIHFGPNTFTRMEWGSGMEDPAIFDLKELDTDQWCKAMQAAGMKMVIITVKHHDGFVLWQSRYTTHGIMSTGFRDGKGDVLKDLSASCQKYGLKLGVYLSPADLFQIESPTGLYGNLSPYTKRTIPRAVEGRPFANKTTFEFEVDDYNEYFLNQLFEILTEYGPIHEVWFDGAHPKTKGGQQYNYPAWKELIRTLAPQAVIFGREDIRWCGNESGNTRDTEWNVLPYPDDPNLAVRFPDRMAIDQGSREKLMDAKWLHYQQAETNTSIREGWFYRDDDRQRVRSVEDVFDMYERSVGGNSTFLLNIPPNRDGRFSDQDVKVLEEVGRLIQKTYGTNLLEGAKGPARLLDNDTKTYMMVENGAEGVEFRMRQPITVNRFMIQEEITAHGERVESHVLDAWVDGAWKEVASATNIGYKRILRFPTVKTDRLRLRILESRFTPSLCNVAAFFYESQTPALSIRQDADGNVIIEGALSSFGWKSHHQDIVKNLNAGMQIFYTTDGSEPTAASKAYVEPFLCNQGTVKAVALLNDKLGEVASSTVFYARKGWQVTGSSASPSSRPWVMVDLGNDKPLAGFAYTPQMGREGGLMARGEVFVSADGKSWNTLGTFEFGNLVNDPSRRFHYFEKTVNARFVKIQASEVTGNGQMKSIAELDFFGQS